MSSTASNSFRLDERELQASALRSQVLARCRRTLNHDINNAVQSMHSGLELLAKCIDTPGSARVSAEDCIGLLRQQLATLRQTLEQIVAQMAEAPGEPERFDLSVLANDALRMLRHERAAENAHTHIEPGVFVRARKINVRSFVLALFLDAVDHLEHGGILEVTVQQHERAAMLKIRTPRSTDDSARARPLVQMVGHLLEAEHGELRVESAGDSHVTIVRLPSCERVLSETPQTDTHTEQSGPARVLIADRNRDAADSLAMILQLEGLHTRALYTGTHLAETLQRFMPDVALVDADLPNCDIREIARAVSKTQGRRPLLAQVSSSDRVKHEEFDVHLLRPVEWPQLQALVERARSN